MPGKKAILHLIAVGGFLCSSLNVGSYGQEYPQNPQSTDTSLEKAVESMDPSGTVIYQDPGSDHDGGDSTTASTSHDSIGSGELPSDFIHYDSYGATKPEKEEPTPVVEKVVAHTDTQKTESSSDANVLELGKDVVVGYGTMKKEDLTGSVTSVKAEELARDAVFSVRKALQGKAAGVTVTQNSGQPGKAVTVRVRGVGTINEACPLYVVDGAPVNNIDYLNPNDIESMAILKDASATAIYGSRGANGVIMVTTKKGTMGERVVSYDMFVGTSQSWKKPSLCNAREWATLVNEAVENANRYITDTADLVDPFEELSDPASLGEGTNWFREITREDAFIQQQNVSLAQGNDRLKLFMSAGLFTQEGIIKNTGFDKVMLRVNSEANVTDWMTIGNNIGFSRSTIDYGNEQDEHNSVLIYALSMDPVTKVRDADGNLLGSPYNNVRNPVGRMEYYDYLEKNTAFTASFFSDVNILGLLKFRSMFSLDMLLRDSTGFIAKYTIASDDQQADALINRRIGIDNTWILENTLSFEHTFNDDHALKLLVGTTLQERSWDSVMAENSQLLGNDPSMRFLNSSIGIRPRVQGTAGGNSLESFFGRMEYEYANRYLLTVTDRIDGSSRFAPDKRWGNFPSAAAAWKVSNEPFMENVTLLEGLKFRAGWGKTGNQEIGDYLFLTLVPSGQNYPFTEEVDAGSAPISEGTPTIHWEAQTATNAGIDVTVLDGKIEFNADYFIRRTDDMLVNPQIPAMAGIMNAPIVNGGSIENRGFEFVVNYRDKIGPLQTGIGFNFSTYRNKVLSLGGDDAPIMDAEVRNSGMVTRTEVGHPMASFYALKTDGLFQTQEEIDNYTYKDENGVSHMIQPTAKPGDIRYRDDDRDGNLDRGFIGSPHPDFTAGLNIDLAFKGFDLGMSFFGVYGNEIFNGVRWYTDNVTGMYSLDSRMLDRWTGPNSTNNVNTPRMNYTDNNNILLSDRYVEDGSYLRLKTIQFGYSFDSELMRKINVKKCRMYVGAENLWTLTNYSGLEPEVGTGPRDNFTNNPSLSLGVDRGTYPQARTYMAGLNLTL